MTEPHIVISRTTESTKEQQILRTEQIETMLRHYYPDHGTSLPDYLQEGIPEVQESYSMSYQTSTSTNGHHGDVDASSNNSQSSVPVDNASLISRSTSETKTQQVKTVTKIIKTREVHHIGPPDGKAISCSPYGTKLPPGSDYLPYNYPGNHEYGTYDPGRPPSPAGQTPTQVYASDYATYARTASPASTGGRNFEIYSPSTCQPYSNYAYQSVATPSGASDSPNLHRAMPQAPRSVATDYNHQPGNYEEIDGAALVPRFVDYRRTPSPTQSADRYDVRFRDPDVHEVIEFLSHPNNIVRANAAAYLQHLCYMNDNMKQKARALGAIPPLIELFNQDIPEIQRNACGALRNISYGRQNDENKRAIKNADGIPALVRLLRKTPDNEIRELVTGILWNLSSCEDLKRPIIDDALNVLVNHVIIPQSGYDRNIPNIFLHEIKPNEIYWSTVFRNASGVLRNVSSAGEYARKKLRSCEGLIEAMVYLVRSAIGKNDIDTNCVENCVCVLRNLSYRLQEIEDPDYDKHLYPTSMQSRASAPLKAVGDHLGCFGGTNKKKKDATEKERREAVPLTKNPISESDPASGFALLWQPEVAQLYISLLTECSNPETLEAAAGAIMNLAACYWEPSIDIRATVRKEKGLPILVELLRMDCDRVVGSVAGALRNLSSDARNRDLIGNYALKDLLLKLPNGSPQHDSGTSDDTIAAVLGTLNEVIAKQTDFARSFLQLGGVERLNQIVQQKGTYSPRVVKFASQLLYNMWQNTELRDAYLKAGFKESHFVPKSIAVRNSLSSPTGANSTLNRPVSTQGGTKYEDRTLPHGTELNSTAASIPYSRSEELPLSELSHSTEPPSQSQAHRPHMGVFPPGMEQARSPADPVYAQVNKRRNKEQRTHSDLPKQQLLTNDQPDGMPAGDSWV
nr:catenin delta-2 isoform X4 [Parasteatoda tepidariorum]